MAKVILYSEKIFASGGAPQAGEAQSPLNSQFCKWGVNVYASPLHPPFSKTVVGLEHNNRGYEQPRQFSSETLSFSTSSEVGEHHYLRRVELHR